MIQDSFLLSFKNLKHRGVRSWLTLLGIFIGITAVVSLISLGNTLQFAVSNQFGISSTEVITIQAGGMDYGPPGSGAVTPLDVKDVEAIQKLSNVKLAIRRNMGSVKLEFKDVVDFAFAGSVPDGDGRDFLYKQIDKKPLLGRFLEDGDTKKVFFGYNFYAAEKEWGSKKLVPGKDVLLNDEKFEVVGILEKKGSLIFDNAIFLNENDMEDLFDYGDDVDIILVQPLNKDLMDKAKEDIEKLLRKRRNVKVDEEDFTVSTPEAAMETVNNILGGVQAFIVIIASISIFIGAIGIINTMTTSVLERKREIGIMKAIGAKNSHIFTQFFIESGLLGLIGGIVGAITGTLLGIAGTSALNNFIGADLSPQINFTLILSALAGSFLIGAVAGIIPAMNAAKQNPVDALRG